MTLITLGYPRGKFVDVRADARGWIYVLQDEATGHLVLVQLDHDGERRVPDVPIPANGGNAFGRLHIRNGTTWLAWRDELVGGRLLNITTGEAWSLGWVYGNDMIAFDVVAGRVWYQADPVYTLAWRSLNNPNGETRTAERGKPDGIARVVAGIVDLIADIRASVPGLSNPQRVGRVVVGENADAGPDRNIARLDDGRECVLWPGLASFRPRIATDGGLYAIATWGSGSCRLALTDPARDYLEPVVAPPPPPPPPPLPDIPWQTDPNGVIEDIAEWLFSRDQGPDITFSPDGKIRFFCKSDEGSGDGPGLYIGEHWDKSDDPNDFNIAHLEDASTGRRVWNGKDAFPWDIPETERAATWASLKLNRNWFKNDRRMWMPRRLVSGTVIRYRTDITWTAPPWETPTTNVWGNITVDIRVDVGYGRYRGREVRARVAYVPNGNEEVNYYGPPNGQNAWVIAAGKSDPWARHDQPQARGLLSAPAPSFDPRDYVRTFAPVVTP